MGQKCNYCNDCNCSGDGVDAAPLAYKNLFPPLEQKIRELQENSGQKRGEIDFFDFFKKKFVVFQVKRWLSLC